MTAAAMTYDAYLQQQRAHMNTANHAAIEACGFKRGDWVCRKGQPTGMTGLVDALDAYEGRKGVRVKAYVRWIGGYGRDHHSTLLTSSLEHCRPATPEQIAEMTEQARALGYSGVGGTERMTYERAEKLLDDYRSGRRHKRTIYCRACNESHVYDQPFPCQQHAHLLYMSAERRWAVYDAGTRRPVTAPARTGQAALALAAEQGIAEGDVYVSPYTRQWMEG